MCTAISMRTKDHYFGRTLDLEYSYNEKVIVTPRRFRFGFRHAHEPKEHYAMIGIAAEKDGYPLYYEAVNEKGLCMAGLNFPGNAFYGELDDGAECVAPFEIIPYILGSCSSVYEASQALEKIKLVAVDFSPSLPITPLHWLISDVKSDMVAEPLPEGLKIYDDPYGVLTNNPPFDKQLFSLNNYASLDTKDVRGGFSEKASLERYSRGMGAMGLPGDLSSQSRYVRAVFTKLSSVSSETEEESVSRFFHVLGTVEQVKGCVVLEDGSYEKTVYTSCCNADKGVYYYTTYGNRAISRVDMYKEDTEGEGLSVFPFTDRQMIYAHN